MKKSTGRIISLLAFSTLFSMSVYADELQDNFLKDLSEGLKERWEYSKGDESTSSYKEELVNKEYARLKGYRKKTFEDPEFGQLANAYLEALKLQKNSLDYYDSYFPIYEKEWEAGFEIRREVLNQLGDQYGLDIGAIEDMEAAEGEELTETVVDEAAASTAAEGEAAADDAQTEQAGTKQLVLFDEKGIRVTLTEIVENDFFVKIGFSVENNSDVDVVVTNLNDEIMINEFTVPSILYIEAGKGKTASSTLTFDKKYAFVKELTEEEKEAAKKQRKEDEEPLVPHVTQLVMGIKVEDETNQRRIGSADTEWIDVDEDYNLKLKPMEVTKDIVKQVQELLNAAGYDCGVPDGLTGPNTNEQIRKFAVAHGLPESEEITKELIEQLQAAVR